jgi:hypothetical protein
MAILYRPDGTQETVTPANGVHWSLEELQTLVGGYYRPVRTRAGHWLVVDEDGIRKRKAPNLAATALYIHGEYDILRGDVLWIETTLELDGPPDPKEE